MTQLQPKKFRQHKCSTCNVIHHIEEVTGLRTVGGKLGGAALGAAVAAETKNPVVIGIAVLLGGALGHFLIDEELVPKCPTCGVVLEALEPVIESYFVPAPVRAFV